MGVVTNGNHWIFCVAGKTHTAGPLIDATGRIETQTLEQLVSLIAAETEEQALAKAHPWSTSWTPIRL
jgi:hypothetical protein